MTRDVRKVSSPELLVHLVPPPSQVCEFDMLSLMTPEIR